MIMCNTAELGLAKNRVLRGLGQLFSGLGVTAGFFILSLAVIALASAIIEL